jgi:2-keto-3-deoxy-6-phosphogluconate aldolase
MTVFDEIRTHGVVPVVVIDDVEQAVPLLGGAAARGGLRVPKSRPVPLRQPLRSSCFALPSRTSWSEQAR